MSKKERSRRYYEKLKSDPKRWEERMENQRKRRSDPKIREAEKEDERQRYAALPTTHPRKNRPDRHTKEAYRRKRQKELETLPDYVVSNCYLNLKVSECPKELINLKREQIRLNRELNIRPRTL